VSESANQPPLRIFIVEDHADTLKSLTVVASQMGFQVHSATCMEQALRAFLGVEFDLLLSDIGLPDGDGWQLLRRAQFRKPVYAIAMSGYGAESDLLKSKTAGFADHLTKPFNFPELKKALLQAAEVITHR
jgi:DNA-binding response OmpR family regulator